MSIQNVTKSVWTGAALVLITPSRVKVIWVNVIRTDTPLKRLGMRTVLPVEETFISERVTTGRLFFYGDLDFVKVVVYIKDRKHWEKSTTLLTTPISSGQETWGRWLKGVVNNGEVELDMDSSRGTVYWRLYNVFLQAAEGHKVVVFKAVRNGNSRDAKEGHYA